MAEGVGRNQGLVAELAEAADERQPEPLYVSLTAVCKRFGRHEAVRDLSLSVSKNEFVTLLGPSGCGKTTVLRMIGGFLEPDVGSVRVDGADPVRVAARQRRTRMVFQHYALFPHLSVTQNVAFGLRMRGERKAEINRRVGDMLARMGLADKADRKPRQLSGGEQQRVALARALITEPTVLLLDEPLGALDRQLRVRMQLELKSLQRELGITFIYVTHDQEEALTMSDRIVVMNRGQIEQAGRAEEIYERPRTRFVAEFIGETSVLIGELVVDQGDTVGLRVGNQTVEGLWMGEAPPTLGRRAVLTVRPENVQMTDAQPRDRGISGVITSRIFKGASTRAVVSLESGLTLLCDEPGNVSHLLGQQVYLSWPAEKATIFAD